MNLGFMNLTDGGKIFEIRNNVQKLFITYEWTGPKMGDIAPATPLRQARVMAYYSGLGLVGKIDVTRYTPNGTKQLIQGVSMYDLAEIAANNDGYIEIVSADEIDPNNVKYITKFSIELCNTGSIKCTDNDFLRVELREFKKYTLAGTDYDGKITINTTGSFTAANEHLKYTPLACNAGALVQFACEGHYAIAVPATCTKLTLNNATGENQEFINTELEHLAIDMEDIVYMVNGISLPFNRWRVIPIQFAFQGTVQLSETAQVFLLSNKSYEAAPKA